MPAASVTDFGNSAMYVAEGDALMKKREWLKAIVWYNKALEVKPGCRTILLSRSRCFLRSGDHAKAIEDAEAALVEDQGYYKGLLQKAEALFSAGQFELALVNYHRGHHVRPDVTEFRLGIQKAKEAITVSFASAVEGKREWARRHGSPSPESFGYSPDPSIPPTIISSSSSTFSFDNSSRPFSSSSSSHHDNLPIATPRTRLGFNSSPRSISSDADPTLAQRASKSSGMGSTAAAMGSIMESPQEGDANQSHKSLPTSETSSVPSVASLCAERTLLGPLYSDKLYLMQLANDPLLADAAAPISKDIKAAVSSGLSFIGTRKAFWQQRNPYVAEGPKSHELPYSSHVTSPSPSSRLSPRSPSRTGGHSASSTPSRNGFSSSSPRPDHQNEPRSQSTPLTRPRQGGRNLSASGGGPPTSSRFGNTYPSHPSSSSGASAYTHPHPPPSGNRPHTVAGFRSRRPFNEASTPGPQDKNDDSDAQSPNFSPSSSPRDPLPPRSKTSMGYANQSESDDEEDNGGSKEEGEEGINGMEMEDKGSRGGVEDLGKNGEVSPAVFKYLQQSLCTAQVLAEMQQALEESDPMLALKYAKVFLHKLPLLQCTDKLQVLSSVLCKVGEAYVALGRWAGAVAVLKKSLAISQRLGNSVATDAVLGQLAETCMSMGDYKQALEVLQQRLRDSKGGALSRVQAHLAQCHYEMGSLEDAVSLAQQSLSTGKGLLEEAQGSALSRLRGSLLDAYLVSAQVLQRQEHFEQAYRDAGEALTLAHLCGNASAEIAARRLQQEMSDKVPPELKNVPPPSTSSSSSVPSSNSHSAPSTFSSDSSTASFAPPPASSLSTDTKLDQPLAELSIQQDEVKEQEEKVSEETLENFVDSGEKKEEKGEEQEDKEETYEEEQFEEAEDDKESEETKNEGDGEKVEKGDGVVEESEVVSEQ